jgi:hypothetical protein
MNKNEIERCWANSNQAMREVLYHCNLPPTLASFIDQLLMYSRDIITWFDPELQGMEFGNRGNGKLYCDALDSTVAEALFNLYQEFATCSTRQNGAMQMVPADRAPAAQHIMASWQHLFGQLHLLTSQYLSEHSSNRDDEPPTMVALGGLEHFHQWITLMGWVLQNLFSGALLFPTKNPECLHPEMALCLMQLHLNMIRDASLVMHGKFKINSSLLQVCHQWSTTMPNHLGLQQCFAELLMWNEQSPFQLQSVQHQQEQGQQQLEADEESPIELLDSSDDDDLDNGEEEQSTVQNRVSCDDEVIDLINDDDDDETTQTGDNDYDMMPQLEADVESAERHHQADFIEQGEIPDGSSEQLCHNQGNDAQQQELEEEI